jgi:hypothetical protein
MNRTLALLLTVAILFAHMLAIHTAPSGQIAPPYDAAHVTYRVARNLVETGSLAWDQGGRAVESFPSLLWVLVAALGTWLGLTVTMFCQTVGTLSALGTVFVLARFSPGRLAGVIAPLLFVVSGSIAAAAASGAETALFALLVAAAFLAFEHRAKWAFGLSLALCVLARDEGVFYAAMLLLLEIAGHLRARDGMRVSLFRWFLPAALALVALTLLRLRAFDTGWSPTFAAWLRPDAERWREGARTLIDFTSASGWTLLLCFPLYYLLRGGLTGVGRRATLLSLGYAALVAFQGGGTGPMVPALAPMIAPMLIAIQEAMTLALDSSRRGWPQVTWALFLTALGLSALASRFPGDLGLLPLEGVHRRWVEDSPQRRLSYQDKLARLGLDEEIDATERLRQLGRFLRTELEPRDSVLTPWPGALAYISGNPVIDALGRTTPAPGDAVPRPWSGLQRVDALRLFELEADYVVPAISWSERPQTLHEIVDAWMLFVDDHPASRGALGDSELAARAAVLRESLRAYELITVPVAVGPSENTRWPSRPFHLLRRRALDRTPQLEIALEGERFRVLARNRSHQQLVDLRVLLVDSEGKPWSVLPTGALREGATGMMRTSLLLPKTGEERSIELAAGNLPRGRDFVLLRAVLRNPQARAEHPFALASEVASVPLR